ncbi:MAG: hypothetical protein R2867_34505 [Caldilineaceae bacterium]
MDRRQATSYSTSLDLPHLPTLSPWSTLSTHHHACNLLAADGTLATLVSEVVGNGPFHIVVPGTRFDRLSDQSQVEWYDGQLRVGHLTIGLQSGRPWNPRLPSLSSQTSFAPLLAYLTQMQNKSALYSGTPALTERAQRGDW